MSEVTKLEWINNDRQGYHTAVAEKSGFTLTFTFKPDDYGFETTDFLGEFHNEHKKDSIDWQSWLSLPINTRLMPWYTSCNYAVNNPKDHEYIRQDIKRLLDYGETWCMCILEVKAWKHDIELGHEVLCGVESDLTKEDLTLMAWDLAEEALAEAREKLALLREVQAEEQEQGP